MEWELYKQKFIEKAKSSHKSDKYITKWLAYAEKISKNNAPIIYSQDHLCGLLGFSKEYVFAASNSPEHFYYYYKIPKKRGGYRNISSPLPNLKEIQRWILDNILYAIDVSPYAKAYVKNKSIKDNVRFHRRQKKVLTLDIKNFFDSLSSWSVYNTFMNICYSSSVSMTLTHLCCLNESLPQGAPTSSALSNIIMRDVDYSIAEICKEKNIRFTRYADDMTFSGDFDERELLRLVRRELKEVDLELNNSKIRMRRQGQQQEVTGIIVNSHPQIPKKARKEINRSSFRSSSGTFIGSLRKQRQQWRRCTAGRQQRSGSYTVRRWTYTEGHLLQWRE